ncbi:hypothetical protein [Streptomyces sp. Amel2xC10]|uniref:hypothetical protein n=1 Tax=Streptomyces sp. Amel2xC10 TaxID=1305826 RepID=UPI000A08DD8B|nr:hypothetical protein [Streptomyces sp. Amel2xC10]SMF64680.1 hypothetical protein SAMN02745830_05036 [Streptomyces sp. Amel2xC10]
MLNLLTSPRTARTVRGLIGSLVESAADAIRAIAPATEQAGKTLAADPADVFGLDEMPETRDVEAAAVEYERAADQARRADRGKRAARKILDRLPAGRYGNWIVERVTSSRQTADLDAIRATYKRLGLGPVPMKSNAPSLKVRRAEVIPADTEVLAGVAA